MDRKTIRYPDGAVELKCSIDEAVMQLANYEDTGLEPKECKTFYNVISKLSGELAKYKEAEKEGCLLVLPCKVGDVVWEITYDCDADDDICVFPTDVCSNCNIGKRVIKPHKVTSLTMAVFYYEKFGETIFLTREEAEAALGGDAT